MRKTFVFTVSYDVQQLVLLTSHSLKQNFHLSTIHLSTTFSDLAISDINYSLLYNDLINSECTEGEEAITQLLWCFRFINVLSVRLLQQPPFVIFYSCQHCWAKANISFSVQNVLLLDICIYISKLFGFNSMCKIVCSELSMLKCPF